MQHFIEYFVVFFAILLIRYFATAGIFYAYYIKIRTTQSDRKILSPKPVQEKQVKKEMYWSVISSAIFALFGAFTYWLWLKNLTVIYINPAQYGYFYLPLSLVLIMLIHETYYYWIHRAMHHRKFFSTVHKVHHLSISSTPWTAFSFHPYESVLEALILPLILMLIPVNIYVLLFYLLFMTLSSVINHLDIEVYPAFFRNSSFGKLWIDATHHHLHHKEFKTNYGLYFTFWDKLMRTESAAEGARTQHSH